MTVSTARRNAFAFSFVLPWRRVNSALDQAIRDETVAKRLSELGADLPAPRRRTPQALGQLVRTEIGKWVPLIEAAGVGGN